VINSIIKKKIKIFQELFTKIQSNADKKNFLLGVDVGTAIIKAVVIKKELRKISVVHHKIVTVSEKEDFPVSQISHIIKKIIKKYPKSAHNVYFNVSREGVFVNRIVLPHIEEKEVLSALKWEIGDRVPFSIDEANIKYKIISSDSGRKSSKELRVLVVAISKGLSQRIIDVCEKSSIYVKAVYVTSCSIDNIVQKFISQDETVGVLDIGYKNSVLSRVL